jgi:hypothetical protein
LGLRSSRHRSIISRKAVKYFPSDAKAIMPLSFPAPIRIPQRLSQDHESPRDAISRLFGFLRSASVGFRFGVCLGRKYGAYDASHFAEGRPFDHPAFFSDSL